VREHKGIMCLKAHSSYVRRTQKKWWNWNLNPHLSLCDVQSYSSLVMKLSKSGWQGHRNASKSSEYCQSVKKRSIDLIVITVVYVYLCILLLYSIVSNNHDQQAYKPLHSCLNSYSCWNWAFNTWNNDYY